MSVTEVFTLADKIVLSVHDDIIAGIHPVDRPIRQDTLALRLGVSKIPVREALNRLEREGLVTSQPNRGFVVRRLSREEAREVIDIRIDIEGRLLAEALEASDEGQRRADGGLAEDAGVTLDDRRGQGWPESFLAALTRHGGLAFTRDLDARLWTLSEHYARCCGDPHAVGRAAEYRRALLEAWRSGQPRQIAQAAERGLTAERDMLDGLIRAADPAMA